jgi:hypothetical protein
MLLGVGSSGPSAYPAFKLNVDVLFPHLTDPVLLSKIIDVIRCNRGKVHVNDAVDSLRTVDLQLMYEVLQPELRRTARCVYQSS